MYSDRNGLPLLSSPHMRCAALESSIEYRRTVRPIRHGSAIPHVSDELSQKARARLLSAGSKHDYFDRRLLNESRAFALWRWSLRSIFRDGNTGNTANSHKPIMVGDEKAQLYHYVNERGRLVRFWVRTLVGNRLLIVGNKDGILPLDVESIHVR